MRHGSIITLPPVRDLPRHGNTLLTSDEEVYSDTICWLSVGQRFWDSSGANMDAQLTTTATAPRCKPCAIWCGSPPWQSQVAHGLSGSELAAKYRLEDAALSHVQSGFGTKEFSPFSFLEWALTRTSFHPRWRRQTCYHHGAELTGIYFLPAQYGQTYHTLWQMPHTSRGLCWKIAYQWHRHWVLSGSYIRILPLI